MSISIILSSIAYIFIYYLLNTHFKRVILHSNEVDISITARMKYFYLRFTLACIYGIIMLYMLFTESLNINYYIMVAVSICISEIQNRSLPVHFKYPCEVKEPFILYLRGFSEDDYVMSWRDLQKRNRYDEFSEGAFFFIARQYMHCYSVGMTKELSSPIGTERVYLTDDNWKDGVIDLMTRASLIFINIHDSDSCMWEIIQSKLFANKTVILCDNFDRLVGMRAKLNRIGYYGLPFFTKKRTYALYNDIEKNYQIFDYDNNDKSYKRIINLILKQKCELKRYFTVTNRFLYVFSIVFGILCTPLLIALNFLMGISWANTIFACIILFLVIISWFCMFPVANYPWRNQKQCR